MELEILSFLILFSCLFLTLIIWKKINKDSNPPPGPWKFPLLGNIPHLLGGLPHQRLRDLAKVYGPVMSIQQGQIPAVVFSSAETANQVLKIQGDLFNQRPQVLAGEIICYNNLDMLFAPYGDYWRQIRKITALEFLSSKRVLSSRSVREEEISKFIKLLGSKGGSSVNLPRIISDLTNSILLIMILGKNGESEQIILPMLENVQKVVIAGAASDLFPSLKFLLDFLSGAKSRMQKVQKDTDNVLDDIINEHKNKTSFGDNFLDVVLNLQKNGDLELTNESIKANIVQMFLGGSETTSKVLEWSIAELMKNPKVMRKTQEEVRRVFGEKGKVEESRIHELKYLKLVIKETLRLHPPATLIVRECKERTKIDGYHIDPKTTVLINVWAIGRDPIVWTKPEKFYPERFEDSQIDYRGANMELIPFGAGKRMCPGITLGITYMELLLANLFFHFDWKLADGITPANLDMTEILHGTLKRKEDLNMIPISFSPLSQDQAKKITSPKFME
ncbi:cytochrome P450 726A27-like [Euphorbia lathyris]|uniref:cytochrome P450 726A27-like n=1 Tax=Euphorbia lathyris TaxID=212925 RepID=UPI0033131C32